LNRGDRRSYVALLARSLGIPAIVGATKATDLFKTGQEITVDCSLFPMGRVYDGSIAFTKTSAKVDDTPITETRVMGRVKPDQIFFQNSPAAAGGVLFLDSVVRNLSIHPLAFSKYDEMKDKLERRHIDEIAVGHPPAARSEYFVETIATAIAQTCAAFHPRNVFVQLADMTSNELRPLIGGANFEPLETNPTYGLRGIARATHDNYKDAFGCECRAIKRVLDMGFSNVIVCVPFVRSVAEVDSFREVLHSFGLETSSEPELGPKLRLYLNIQVPSNIFFAPKLSKQFAGFIVDVKRLTSSLYCSEMDDAAYRSFLQTHAENLEPVLGQVVQAARASNIPVGLRIHSDEHAAISPWITSHKIDFLVVDADRVTDTINIVSGRERSESLSSLSKSGHVSGVSESSGEGSESASLGEALEHAHLKAE
jgi:pyruvate, water dikinase